MKMVVMGVSEADKGQAVHPSLLQESQRRWFGFGICLETVNKPPVVVWQFKNYTIAVTYVKDVDAKGRQSLVQFGRFSGKGKFPHKIKFPRLLIHR